MMYSKMHNIGHAPVLENDDKYSEDKTVVMISKPVKPAVWKPDPYSRYLFNRMFEKWGVRV